MANSFEGVLANIPGLGGFLAGQQEDQQRAMSTLTQMVQMQGLQGNMQKQQELARVRQIIQSGGSPEQVIQQLVGVGPEGAAMAQHYAAAQKGLQEAKIREQLAGGKIDLNDPDTLERLGASGLSNTAHLTLRAARIRAAQEDAKALRGMQGVDTPVPRGIVAPGASPEATDAALMEAYKRQGGGSVETGSPGEPSILPPTTKQGGSFEPLINSSNPNISQAATRLQEMVDKGQITGKQAESRLAQLEARQTAIDAAAGRQQTVIDNRSEPLVAIIKDGKKVLVPRSEAVGATPASERQSVPVVPEEHSHLTGAEYLKTLPIGTQNKVKALAEGRVPLTSFSLRNNERDAMVQMVQQYDPSFEAGKSPARMAVQKDFTSGPSSRNVTALNTAIAHLGTMKKLGDALANGDIRAINMLANEMGVQLGKEEKTDFALAQTAVGDEMMRVFRQVGASEREAEDWRKKFNSSASPTQMNGALRTAAELLKGRIDALNDTWDRGMDTSGGYPKLLSDRSKEAMASFGASADGKPAAPQYPSATAPNGRKVIFKDGKWQTPP